MPKDLIHFMQVLFLPAAERLQESVWRPAMDVHRTRGGWRLKFELAGVRPEDITVLAQGNRLSVSGFRRDTCPGGDEHCYAMEIAYCRFERTVELPCDVESARFSVDYRDGMLVIQIRTEAPGE